MLFIWTCSEVFTLFNIFNIDSIQTHLKRLFIYMVQIVWDTANFADLKTVYFSWYLHPLYSMIFIRYYYTIVCRMKHTSGDIKDTISTIPIMFNSIKFRIAYILEYPDLQYGNSKRLSVYFCAKFFEVKTIVSYKKKYFLLLLNFFNWSFLSLFYFYKKTFINFVLKHARLSW